MLEPPEAGWISSRADRCLQHLRSCRLQPQDVRDRAGAGEERMERNRDRVAPVRRTISPEPAPPVYDTGASNLSAMPEGSPAGPAEQSCFGSTQMDDFYNVPDPYPSGSYCPADSQLFQSPPGPGDDTGVLLHHAQQYLDWDTATTATPNTLPYDNMWHSHTYDETGTSYGVKEGMPIPDVGSSATLRRLETLMDLQGCVAQSLYDYDDVYQMDSGNQPAATMHWPCWQGHAS